MDQKIEEARERARQPRKQNSAMNNPRSNFKLEQASQRTNYKIQPNSYIASHFQELKESDFPDFMSEKSLAVPNFSEISLDSPLVPSGETNLDRKGESHWVYPEENGKYIIPQPVEVPTAASRESVDANEFESIPNQLGSTPKSVKSVFPRRQFVKGEYKEVYTSNIASIVNSAFSVYPKKKVVKTIYQTSDKPRAKFPRDVFKASFKSKHMIP
jgi:hypothetical protein